jgi:eukaryotic-like serine/threonine-protein kinase
MAEVEADATRAEPVFDPLVGTVVNGRFHILKRIARGGMGSVYFATQAPLSRPVAVKVLHLVRENKAESEGSFRRRFLQEASILARLQHPNIVMLLDYGQIAGLPTEHYFMAMEYLRGETLAERFKAQGRLTVSESIGLARQVGRGLREAHRCGFIHRDLKPSNIMLVPVDEQNDIVKLVDFGIGKIVAGGPEQAFDIADETRAGIVLGSPRYMSPEQIRSEPVEPRTDVYGLGVILFQALTGRVPFEGTSWEIMLAHCSVKPPKLAEASPGLAFPESLSQLVLSLLEKPIANRPTVEEFLRKLGTVEEEVFGAGFGGASSPRSTPIPLTGPTSLARPEQPSWMGLSRRPAAPLALVPTEPPVVVDTPETRPPPGLGEAFRRPARRTLVVTGIAAVVLLAAGVPTGRILLGSSRVHVVTTGATATGASETSSASSAVQLAPAQERVATFALTIDSTPTGATVMEDGNTLGITPLTLTIARTSAGAVTRRFIVVLDGYAPYVLEQGDSDQAVRLHAALLASSRPSPTSPARSVTGARPRAQLNNPSTPLEGSSTKRNDGSGLEIRLRR